MKIASRVFFIFVDTDLLTHPFRASQPKFGTAAGRLSDDKYLLSRIQKMYDHAYGESAGSVERSWYGGNATPNEERLLGLLRRSFTWGESTYKAINVFAGEDEYVFVRQNDEYACCADIPEEQCIG